LLLIAPQAEHTYRVLTRADDMGGGKWRQMAIGHHDASVQSIAPNADTEIATMTMLTDPDDPRRQNDQRPHDAPR
jgi:hypothetical protein